VTFKKKRQMCGIFGCVGCENATPLCLAALERLEYRGYDSAGLAGLRGGDMVCLKEAGRVANVAALAADVPLSPAVAHTRWATHGAPTRANAHPHADASGRLALVHNGIIENCAELRAELEASGVAFRSDTDTEVVAQLIGRTYERNRRANAHTEGYTAAFGLFNATMAATRRLRGAWALALVHVDAPDRLIATKNASPLLVGLGDGLSCVASDASALPVCVGETLYLDDHETAVVTVSGAMVFSVSGHPVHKQRVPVARREPGGKGNYAHYMLKEIHEQPQALRNTMRDIMVLDMAKLRAAELLLFVGCGSSHHAGMVAALACEPLLPARAELASELIGRVSKIPRGTVVVAVSQSGETKDTLSAARALKARGAHIVAVCNARQSTLAREADRVIYLNAGEEVSVCSTKAHTCQLVALHRIAAIIGRMDNVSLVAGAHGAAAAGMHLLADQVQTVLERESDIRALAQVYAQYRDVYFIGRHQMHACALEGALKLKEVACVNANGCAAGELKHGHLALVGPECATVALCCNQRTHGKIISAMHEIKARGGPVLAVAAYGDRAVDIADHVLWVPACDDALAPVLVAVACQLLAYHIALAKGVPDVDRPRNLAKSVTVE
jgi:glucosamine--fructose-6-phosphate aminotransferase (isomerizing)